MRRIFAILAAAASKLINSLPTAGKWLDDLISAPFRIIFGGGQETPSYTPEVPASDYVNILRDARETAAAQTKRFDRDVLESVLEYCRAHPDGRATMKLPSTLDVRVRATLLMMDDDALRALSRAGISQVKRFVAGIPHDIPDVPGYGEARPTAANDQPPPNLTANERILWKVRARIEKENGAKPFTNPRVASI